MIIATHDGVFHGDDVLAGAIVRLVWPEATIVRTRDKEQINAASLSFDVGGGDYDHHQRGGNGERPNGIPYASAGLLWEVYGAQVCGAVSTANPLDASDVDTVFDPSYGLARRIADEVDRQLVQSVDAHDNGFQISAPTGKAISCTISHVLSNFNPSWDEEQDYDARYFEAVAFATTILERAIVRARGVAEAHSVVQQAVADAADARIVELPYFVPWQEALVEASASVLLCVYPSAGTWRVQVVPVVPGQPSARLSIPEAWAGLEGEALAAVTGVADATFAHRGRFIAGAKSRDGALKLAQVALA